MNAKKAIEAYQALLVDLRHVVDDMAAVEEARAEIDPEGGNSPEAVLAVGALQGQVQAALLDGLKERIEVRVASQAEETAEAIAKKIAERMEPLAQQIGARMIQKVSDLVEEAIQREAVEARFRRMTN
ncbi:MAG: hypothetical protein JNM56_12895 [Planctomycetia bacterium]|nr:hypothetical protein [Planctomycetia bacterium]